MTASPALTLDRLDPDPIVQFRLWLDEATGAEGEVATAMSLATVSADGVPSVRTVLLKACDHDGFTFFTNLESTKARQIAGNPHVSLLFFWRTLDRQVRITGVASRLATAAVARYFLSRPRESQVAAWVSPQSRVVDAREALTRKFEEAWHHFRNGNVPVPPFWGGFQVAPIAIEFWQGGRHRLHDRFEYSRTDAGWDRRCLAP